MAKQAKETNANTDEKTTIDRYGDFAKNVWLAGLGAYGKAFDEAKDVYEKASKETPKLFDELVKKGEKLEEDTIDRIQDTQEKLKKNKISDSLSEASSSIEDRIQKVRGALGMGSESQGDLERLEAKLDKLVKSVDSVKKSVNSIKKSLAETEAKPVVEAKPAAEETA